MVSFRDISQKLTLSQQTWSKATAQKRSCRSGGEKEYERVSDPRARGLLWIAAAVSTHVSTFTGDLRF